MTIPTHIVAVGGIVENEQGKILFSKDTSWWLGISWGASRNWIKSNGCIK